MKKGCSFIGTVSRSWFQKVSNSLDILKKRYSWFYEKNMETKSVDNPIFSTIPIFKVRHKLASFYGIDSCHCLISKVFLKNNDKYRTRYNYIENFSLIFLLSAMIEVLDVVV